MKQQILNLFNAFVLDLIKKILESVYVLVFIILIAITHWVADYFGIPIALHTAILLIEAFALFSWMINKSFGDRPIRNGCSRWTAEENVLLVKLWPDLKNLERILQNRSSSAIKSRARRIGLYGSKKVPK